MSSGIERRLSNLETAIKVNRSNKGPSPIALSKLSDEELKLRLFERLNEIGKEITPTINERLSSLGLGNEYAAYKENHQAINKESGGTETC